MNTCLKSPLIPFPQQSFVVWKCYAGVPSNMENNFLWSGTIFTIFYGRFGFSRWVKENVAVTWTLNIFFFFCFYVSTRIFYLFIAKSEKIHGNSTTKVWQFFCRDTHFGRIINLLGSHLHLHSFFVPDGYGNDFFLFVCSVEGLVVFLSGRVVVCVCVGGAFLVGSQIYGFIMMTAAVIGFHCFCITVCIFLGWELLGIPHKNHSCCV